MPKRIVDLFKIIQVKHDESQRMLIPYRSLEFTRGEFKKVAVVAQPCQAIRIRQ